MTETVLVVILDANICGRRRVSTRSSTQRYG